MSSPKYIDRCYDVDLNERKESAQFTLFSRAPGSQNGVFRTFLHFEKTKALQHLLIVFSKITHYRGYLSIIWRN